MNESPQPAPIDGDDFASSYVDWSIPAEPEEVDGISIPPDDDDSDYMLPLASVGDRSWMVDAKCRVEKMPTADFYVSRQRTLDVLPLRLFCRACPVRWECLDFAIANGDRYGVWGGYVDKERRKIRRRMEEAGITLQEAANSIRNLDAIPASRRKSPREG